MRPASLVSAIPADAALVTLETRQLASAVICGGTPCIGAARNRVINSSTDGVSHSNNLAGTLLTPSEARTAARSGPLEIAANATLRHREQGPFVDYPEVSSDALYEIDVLALHAGPVYFDFHLPPGFVEIQSNAEFGDILELSAEIQADIQFCSPACEYSAANPGLFQVYSTLRGGYHTHVLENFATSSDPTLDVSPLIHSNVIIDPPEFGFIRTKTWNTMNSWGESRWGTSTPERRSLSAIA